MRLLTQRFYKHVRLDPGTARQGIPDIVYVIVYLNLYLGYREAARIT